MATAIDFHSIHRINVIGTSGCGKSTFSKKLAMAMNASYIEMDKIFWGPNWSWLSDDEFYKKLHKELKIDKWVLDGNYTRTTPIKWENVQMVVWLDYSFIQVFSRAVRRAIWRAMAQIEIWEGTGNRESFRMLFSKDSIVLWTLNTFRENKAKYSAMMGDARYAHITFVRLSNTKEAKDFLKNFI